MQFVIAEGKDIEKYIKFTQEVYKGNRFYKDSLTGILKSILYRKNVFSKNVDITPVMVMEDNMVLAVGTFIITEKLQDTIQIAFFEAKEGYQEAVDIIVGKAKKKCKDKNLNKIIIGLNGHVNYGLGLLADHFNSEACFGSSYNPQYYLDYFKKYDAKDYELKSYIWDMNKFNLEREKKVLKRISKYFSFRKADFRKLRQEVEIYTYLNNECFNQHPYYFERTVEEDYELIDEFRLFINGENFLIAEKDGVPVGFMLWYPDFNQLIRPGGCMEISTFIKNKLFSSKINKFKIAEIGVIPKYQGSGVILGLLNKCMEYTKGRYDYGESGWVLDSNIKSREFCSRMTDNEYKHYKVFEIGV